MPARILPETSPRRQDVQAGVSAVQTGAPNPDGDWQGQEPLAQRGCALGRHPPILRTQGDELLHCAFRRVPRPRHSGVVDLGQGAGSAHRASQVHVH
jgi:hypothetical protein